MDFEDQRKRKDGQVLGPCQGTKKAKEHERDVDTNCIRRTWNRHQRFAKVPGRTNRDHPNSSIDVTGENTEKSPTQNMSWRIRRTNSSGILKYKRITKSGPDDHVTLRPSTPHTLHPLLPFHFLRPAGDQLVVRGG